MRVCKLAPELLSKFGIKPNVKSNKYLQDKKVCSSGACSCSCSGDVCKVGGKCCSKNKSKLCDISSIKIFNKILGLQGEIFRELEGRRTLKFTHEGRGYFAKLHFGIGWREIFKNLFQGRLPILGAGHEYNAVNKLTSLGVDTLSVKGYGSKGLNPSRRKSFLITKDLVGMISLEDLCKTWSDNPPNLLLKRSLIARVALIARTIHKNGVNHRDFYLCHFLLDPRILKNVNFKGYKVADVLSANLSGGVDVESKGEIDSSVSHDQPHDGVSCDMNVKQLKIHLIDLHRAQIRKSVPKRWLVKDLAGLYFSAMDFGITSKDIFRFMRIYFDCPLRDILKSQVDLLSKVNARAIKLYQKDFGRMPPNE